MLGRGGDVGKGPEGQTEPPGGQRKPLTLVRCPWSGNRLRGRRPGLGPGCQQMLEEASRVSMVRGEAWGGGVGTGKGRG